jgi:hypothetical protein
MKKKFIYVSLFMTLSVFTFSSCGGSSSEPEEDLTDQTEMVEEEITEEADKLDVNSFTSADEAMEEYKTMLENYADLVKSGSTAEAEALKAQLDELKSFSEDKWGAASLKAMANLSKYALQIEAGKDIDLDDAFKAYDKSLEVMKNMPGMDAESEKAMDEAQDAMKQMQSLGM